jgi:hypothetical protein
MSGKLQEQMTDLPSRTWHRWWLEWPKWFRIGCWAAIVMFGMQVVMAIALAIRVHYGLKPTPEIAALQRRGVLVVYDSNRYGEPFRGYNDIVDGVKGRTNADVTGIRFPTSSGDQAKFRATEADLLDIGRQFPNLEWLAVGDGDITVAVLADFQRLMNLRTLELAQLDIDDAIVEQLSQLKRLNRLDLAETLVTDASVPLLQSISNLEHVNLSYTDVSLAAIQNWRAAPRTGTCFIGTEKVAGFDAVLGSIRWKDGGRSAGFPGSYSRIQKFAGGSSSEMSTGLTRTRLWWPPSAWGNGNGDYQLSLKLGDYESEPVTVTVQDGKPSIDRIEFVMPCTKAEALGLLDEMQPLTQ